MSKKLFRITRPTEATFPGERFLFTSFTPFTMVRFLSGQTCERGRTITELCAPNGHRVRVSKFFVDELPAIVTTTREHEGFDACTTFNLDHSVSWPDGLVAVHDHRTGLKFYLPAKILAPAALHSDRMEGAVAV